MNLSGAITSNPFEILEGVKTFYKNLYTSKRVDLNGEDSRGFFKNEHISKLSEEFKETCEGRVRIEEITEVLKSFKDRVLWVLENLESPGILLCHFPGLESPGKRPLVLESSGNLLNSTKKYEVYGRQ